MQVYQQSLLILAMQDAVRRRSTNSTALRVEVVRHPANANVGRWCTPNQGDLFTRQPDAKGFTVLPKRWVVERTHAWIEKARRLVMHHDRRVEVSEAWVWLAAGRQLLNRLTHTA